MAFVRAIRAHCPREIEFLRNLHDRIAHHVSVFVVLSTHDGHALSRVDTVLLDTVPRQVADWTHCNSTSQF